MFQDGTDLVQTHPGEPLDKLGYLRPAFEVLEQGSDGNACTTKYPRPAHASRVAFDFRTC